MISSSTTHVLSALIQDPLLNISKLHEKLETAGYSISYYAVSQTYQQLLDQQLLRQQRTITDVVVPGGSRLQTEVEANYSPETLDLVRHHVIFWSLQSEHSITLFEQICDFHPYTHYRSLLMGVGLHAYAQFDVPANATELMDEFYQQLLATIDAKKYTVIQASYNSISEIALHRFLSDTADHWDFSIDGDRSDNLENTWNALIAPTSYIKNDYVSVIDKLDKLDLLLLRELTLNAKVKSKDLVTFYNKDRTTLQRRITKLSEQVLTTPSLYYNRQKFDLSSPQMIYGTARDATTINKLHMLLSGDNFPFRAELISDKNEFLCNMLVPPSLAPEISHFIWKKIHDVQILTFGVGIQSSWKYPFYPNNYDTELKQWKVSRNYLIDSVFGQP